MNHYGDGMVQSLFTFFSRQCLNIIVKKVAKAQEGTLDVRISTAIYGVIFTHSMQRKAGSFFVTKIPYEVAELLSYATS